MASFLNVFRFTKALERPGSALGGLFENHLAALKHEANKKDI
jgi:hypothetical protein